MKLHAFAATLVLTCSPALAQGPAVGNAAAGTSVPSAQTINGGLLELIFAPHPFYADAGYAIHKNHPGHKRTRRRH